MLVYSLKKASYTVLACPKAWIKSLTEKPGTAISQRHDLKRTRKREQAETGGRKRGEEIKIIEEKGEREEGGVRKRRESAKNRSCELYRMRPGG